MSLPELPNGSQVFIGKLGAAIVMSSLENGLNPDAALAAGHGVTTGSILLINNGWSITNNHLFKAGTVAGDVAPLLGVDTTSTAKYPTAGGPGSVHKVTEWVEIIELSDWAVSNGKQNYRDRRTLAALQARKIPTFRDASTGSFKILNDITVAHYLEIKAASDALVPAPLKILTPSGKERFAMAYFSISDFESMDTDTEMMFDVDLSFLAAPTRYQPA